MKLVSQAVLTVFRDRTRRMAKREREIDEFETVSEISHASPNAKVHGVISSLSPMKKSKTCSYFDGEVTDGKSCMRVFGFDVGVRKRLALYEETKEPVAISNCEVKNSRRGKDLEVLVTKSTDLTKSDKQFNIDTSKSTLSKRVGSDIDLCNLKDLEAFQRVNVKVKAIRLEEVEEVPDGKKIQNIIIADLTGTVRLTVWEKEIGKIEIGGSYSLTGMTVREFRGRKFLSTAKDNSSIVSTEDIGEVAPEGENTIVDTTPQSCSWVKNVRVVGVITLEKYSCCIKCSTKLVPDDDDADLGHCSKCQMMQCIDNGSNGIMAKLMVVSGGTKLILCAFGKVVENIATKPAEEVTIPALLKATPFKMTHVDGIIQNISRK